MCTNRDEFRASACFPSRDTTLQTIKISISKDLELCVEGGFSQIQSHIALKYLVTKAGAEPLQKYICVTSSTSREQYCFKWYSCMN